MTLKSGVPVDPMKARSRATSPHLTPARGGDPAAFDRLVRPLLGELLALCRRLAPAGVPGDELLQEGLIKAHRGITGFRCDCSFRSWLVGILYRLASEPDRLRAREHALELAETLPDGIDADPLERVSAKELLHRVEGAMERLPRRQRAALHLRAVAGWSYAEIARSLETSEGAVRNSVLEARRKLRSRLGDLL